MQTIAYNIALNKQVDLILFILNGSVGKQPFHEDRAIYFGP